MFLVVFFLVIATHSNQLFYSPIISSLILCESVMQSQRLFLNSQSLLVRLTHSSRRSFFNMGGKSSAPSDSTTEFVNNAIKSDHIAVFSKSYCPYCDRTKQTLSQLNGVTVKTYELVRLVFISESYLVPDVMFNQSPLSFYLCAG
jgi:thiol-disulfide isomerase/thioredoxin